MSWNFTQYLNGVGAPFSTPSVTFFWPLPVQLDAAHEQAGNPQKQSQYFLFLFRNWCVSRDVQAVFKEGQTCNLPPTIPPGP